ncbi:MAG: class I SAM-dependent methyltransferase [Lachnospiraceae bacterium]|nr:class I SAM-dependent methyltransferase [Lachnospiraceae bacterium]
MSEEKTIEKIGNITLNLKHYEGTDVYTDGDVEDELLAIVRDLSPVEYPKVIEERGSWPILYHLSTLRENIVDWLPIKKTDKVLEVGSGCGAITGALSRKAGSVTCVDLSKKRSTINAYKNADCDNVTIHVGNFKDIEPDLDTDFDYVCLIGVFEYGQGYMGSEKPYHDFLNILRKHVKKDGRLVIAIENKFGLKYFAGCKEDHVASYFAGIENYAKGGGVRTFTRNGLEKIMKECGVKKYHFYYPYPDYKFPTVIFSDKHLPKKGELSNNMRNFDMDRMLLFDEKNAFDGIIEDDLFWLYSNSYMVVIGEDVQEEYARFSNDRADEFAIKTVMETVDGKKVVRKYPISKAAYPHILSMKASYDKLCEKYEGSRLSINRCEIEYIEDMPVATFEFVEGVMLSELLDACLEREDHEGFKALFNEYFERISYNETAKVSDYDLIFSNILVNGDEWTVIDYEWTFDKEYPARELAFRALYCYLLESESRNKCDMDELLKILKITEKDSKELRENELSFQKWVTKKRMSMSEMRDKIGYKIVSPEKYIEENKEKERIERVQIYENKGQGYSEETSYFLTTAEFDKNHIEMDISFDGNVIDLRIDPLMDACVVLVKELTVNGYPLPEYSKKYIEVNGRSLKGDVPGYVFGTSDPNMNIHVSNMPLKGENTLHCVMDFARMTEEIGANLLQSVKRIF